ncbi:MAG TPA: pyridoxamine 5'-phosphate oxidase family protein [Syntrophales bacterium]|nr:pyridoxamine 5'-phosphate oxidase family protein [Syntrophales bacterium]HNS53268.1 pyridoxamine 5'-phosphate oxidase family protein [Syntrophales bacterium]
MEEMGNLRARLDAMLQSQRLAVLSTAGAGGAPYSNLVSFAALGTGRLLFATTRATRKYANLTADARVALLVDNRRGQEADFHEALAATALGSAVELAGEERDRGIAAYTAKFPFLEEFVRAPSCALFRVDVERWIVVTRFQNVIEVSPLP